MVSGLLFHLAFKMLIFLSIGGLRIHSSFTLSMDNIKMVIHILEIMYWLKAFYRLREGSFMYKAPVNLNDRTIN